MTPNFYFIAIVGLISVFVVRSIASYISAARFKKAHGCKPVHKLPQSERIIGYDLYKLQVQATKDKNILDAGRKRYEAQGVNTWSASILGRTFYNTIEPENVKAVLATNFKDFGLGDREGPFGPLLGRGIFTSDGAHWEHSRVGTAW
jgi:hypothetical protein